MPVADAKNRLGFARGLDGRAVLRGVGLLGGAGGVKRVQEGRAIIKIVVGAVVGGLRVGESCGEAFFEGVVGWVVRERFGGSGGARLTALLLVAVGSHSRVAG